MAADAVPYLLPPVLKRINSDEFLLGAEFRLGWKKLRDIFSPHDNYKLQYDMDDFVTNFVYDKINNLIYCAKGGYAYRSFLRAAYRYFTGGIDDPNFYMNKWAPRSHDWDFFVKVSKDEDAKIDLLKGVAKELGSALQETFPSVFSQLQPYPDGNYYSIVQEPTFGNIQINVKTKVTYQDQTQTYEDHIFEFVMDPKIEIGTNYSEFTKNKLNFRIPNYVDLINDGIQTIMDRSIKLLKTMYSSPVYSNVFKSKCKQDTSRLILIFKVLFSIVSKTEKEVPKGNPDYSSISFINKEELDRLWEKFKDTLKANPQCKTDKYDIDIKSLPELLAAGYQVKDLRYSFTPLQLKQAGVHVDQIINANVYKNKKGLRDAGFTIDDLLKFGYRSLITHIDTPYIEELLDAGYSNQDLLDAGFSHRVVETVTDKRAQDKLAKEREDEIKIEDKLGKRGKHGKLGKRSKRGKHSKHSKHSKHHPKI